MFFLNPHLKSKLTFQYMNQIFLCSDSPCGKKKKVSIHLKRIHILCVCVNCSVIGRVQAIKWSLCTSPAVGHGGSMFQVELI